MRLPDRNGIERILLIRTDRIGDVMLSLPMLPVLKRNFPNADISVMVRNYTRELVEGHSCVTEIIPWEQNGDRSLMHYVGMLRDRAFDIAIIPYPRFILALIVFLAGIPIRVGTGYRWYSFLFNAKVFEHRRDARRHEAEYNLNLLSALGIHADGPMQFEFTVTTDAEKNVDAVLSRDGVGTFVVLHPGSGGSARDWSVQKFAALGDAVMNDLHMTVVVTGGKNEQHLVASMISQMRTPPVNYCGVFSLQELGALYKRAKVFVSNSTGPLHIASAVGVPVMAFYPPIVQCSPVRWGPSAAKKRIYTADANRCELCNGGACRSNVCMDQITVDEVMKGMKELLHENN